MRKLRTDKPFFIVVALLVFFGILIFFSASMGLWTRENINPIDLAFKQIFIGLFLGIITANFTSRIPYKLWKIWSPYLFFLSVLATLLVFIPGIGFSHGGATRWISLGGMSIQPSEFLKIGFIIYLAALLSKHKNKILNWREGVAPFFILICITGAIFVKQPDIDMLVILFFTGVCMLVVARAQWKHIFLIMIIAVLTFGALIALKPYIKERMLTFLNPERDSQGASYQIQQSLIAIGSGGVFGRGFGQSVQKFGALPEPIGDSVFSVAAEEFGFIGATILILCFAFFLLRGLKLASHSPDSFGRLLASGIVILIVSQSFLNIGAMMGLLPLSGIPLLFVSHGGTALLVTLAEV
ncbi:MAG: cell division protein FtsW, partial [Candidatus Pacebacteria bacterium]|nr:cell division protein FtsW [Candidatus Paceibacterota bacterium]